MKNIKQYTAAENFQIMKEKYSFRKKKLFETDVNNSFVTIARTTTSCLKKKNRESTNKSSTMGININYIYFEE